MLVFLCFSCVFLSLGLYCLVNKSKAIKSFIYLIVLLPIGGVFSGGFIKSAVAVYEFFYIGLFLTFIFASFQKKTYSLLFVAVSLLVPILVILGVIYGSEIEFILKDIKPFIVLIVAIVLIHFIKHTPQIISDADIRILLAGNVLKCIFIFILGNYFGLNAEVSDDQYFSQNEGFRYSDIGTLFVVFYFIYKLVHKIKFNFFDVLCILIPILITQQRTLLLSLLIILFIYYLFNGSLISKFTLFTFIPLTIFLFFYFVGGRLFDVLDKDIILKLFSIRFSPFVNELPNFKSITDYLFGLGLGKPFYIPWFEYRENINNLNPSIDNIYLTYFMKFGISFIFILLLFYYVLQKNIYNKKFVRYLCIYMLLQGVTTAFSYQSAFLFIFTFPVLFSMQKKHGKIASLSP